MEISFHPVISAPHPHPCFFGAAFFLFCFVNAFYLILFLSHFLGSELKKIFLFKLFIFYWGYISIDTFSFLLGYHNVMIVSGEQ